MESKRTLEASGVFEIIYIHKIYQGMNDLLGSPEHHLRSLGGCWLFLRQGYIFFKKAARGGGIKIVP